jgi:hypothetical protein
MFIQTFKWQINNICNIHIQGDLPNIFIFSTARSGSTWLMEMISTQKGIKFISEPLLLSKLAKGRSPIPTSWEFVLPSSERRYLLKSYFNNLISNKTGIGNPSPRSNLHKWISNRIVFKILRCKDLMNWFEEEFKGQIVYLLRHPVPTNLSRKRYSILPFYLKNDVYCKRYIDHSLRRFCETIIENGTEFQRKILDWCLQNLPPLKYLDRRNWLILYYEDMVMDPSVTLDIIIQHLKLKEKNKILKRYYRASESTIQSDTDTQKFFIKNESLTDREFLISKWRSKITAEEEVQAFEILDKFGINIYKFGNDMPDRRI